MELAISNQWSKRLHPRNHGFVFLNISTSLNLNEVTNRNSSFFSTGNLTHGANIVELDDTIQLENYILTPWRIFTVTCTVFKFFDKILKSHILVWSHNLSNSKVNYTKQAYHSTGYRLNTYCCWDNNCCSISCLISRTLSIYTLFIVHPLQASSRIITWLACMADVCYDLVTKTLQIVSLLVYFLELM